MNKIPDSVQQIVNAHLNLLSYLNANLVKGFYLTGSTILKDYYSTKSDIDFIALLKNEPTAEELSQIERIHRIIEKTYDYPKLNGYYMTSEGIQNNQAAFPSFFKNKMFYKRPFELNKVALFEWKTASYCIYGTPAAYLPIDVEINEVMIQLHQNINSYWTSWISKHSSPGINQILLICFPRLTEWGILGVARQLYTLHTGKITSKLAAGMYCLEKLPSELREILNKAIEARRINKTQFRPSLKRAKKTLECMQFIISEFNAIYNSKVQSGVF